VARRTEDLSRVSLVGPEDLPVREATVLNGSGRLYVREAGDGHPVVVVHGGPDFSHQYLLPDLDRLADSVRLVYYDQRGRGRSFDADGSDAVTIESEVGDLDAVCRSVDVGPVALLGHSWGCLLALEHAVRYPAGVSHLILMNSSPVSTAGAIAMRHELARRRTPDETAAMRRIVSSPEYRNGQLNADAAYYRIHFATAFHRRDLLETLVGRLRVAVSPEGIVRARRIEQALYEQTWSGNYDLLPRLRSVRIPTLVIHGDRDFVPVGIAEEIASGIDGATLVVLTHCGHFAYLDQPDEVHRRVVEFVSRR